MTLQSNPGTYYSVHGDLLFVVIDVTKVATYSDYRYVCDVYVGTTLVARLKAFPRPDNKMGVFNIGTIVRSYMATAFNPAPNTIYAQEFNVTEWHLYVT